jgi:SAM-dependent methyltransferase
MDPKYAKQYETLFHQHWWWRTRNRILEIEIGRLHLPKHSTILDVGCGNGLFFSVLARWGDVWGIETDIDLLSNDNLFRDRITSYPIEDAFYDNNCFDLITVLDVLEHVKEDQVFISRVVQLLNSEGYIVLTVPAFSYLWDDHDRINDHFRRYNRNDIKHLFTNHGNLIVNRYLFPSLFFLKIIYKFLNRMNLMNYTHLQILHPSLNNFFELYYMAENKLQSVAALPLGSSILTIFQKP